MPECECLTGCSFFCDKRKMTPSLAEIKQRYCQTENKICARYMVMKTLGRDKVPPDLYPFELNQAIQIIQGGKAAAHVS